MALVSIYNEGWGIPLFGTAGRDIATILVFIASGYCKIHSLKAYCVCVSACYAER